MASEDFVLHIRCARQSFLLIDSPSGILIGNMPPFLLIFLLTNSHIVNWWERSVGWGCPHLWTWVFQQIARFNDGPIAFTNRQSYGRRLLDLRLRAIALSTSTHIENRCYAIGSKCRHPSPLVASTGQASDPIRRVATLLSPVFLLNSRHPLFCDTLLDTIILWWFHVTFSN